MDFSLNRPKLSQLFIFPDPTAEGKNRFFIFTKSLLCLEINFLFLEVAFHISLILLDAGLVKRIDLKKIAACRA